MSTTESSMQRFQSSRRVSVLSCTGTCFTTTNTNTTTTLHHDSNHHNKGLALCRRVILDSVAPPWVPARTPTVHGRPYAGRLWVVRQHVTTRHEQRRDQVYSVTSDEHLNTNTFTLYLFSYFFVYLLHSFHFLFLSYESSILIISLFKKSQKKTPFCVFHSLYSFIFVLPVFFHHFLLSSCEISF